MANTYIPVIVSAVLSPNPAQAGAAVLISVSATDVVAVPSVIDVRSGEFQSGEW